MDNGANGWAVSYSSILFFDGMLRQHGNVAQVLRSHDILFAVTRKRPADCIYVLIVNKYSFGSADFHKARAEFPEATCIVQVGKWNEYTPEAKSQANVGGIGLLKPEELGAAIRRKEPHKCLAKARNGNRV